MKKGALASGALALGGSAIGSAAAQEDGGDGGGGAEETVLMLHPDAVEDAEFTVASGEIDWSPIDDGAGQEDGGAGVNGAGGDDEDAGGDDAGVGDDDTGGNVTGEETPATPDGGTTPADGGGAGDFTTYMIEYGFSASHVAPVFVEGDVDLSEGDEQQLGEIEEIVEQPGGAGADGGADTPEDDGGLGDDDDGGAGGDDAGTDGVGQEGEPLFVRVGLEDGADDGLGDDEETPEEPGDDDGLGDGTETPGEPGDGGDDGLGDGTETPADGGDGEDDDGLFDF